MAFGTSDRSAASSASWSGCSASTFPVQPMSRVVVSFPAPLRGEHSEQIARERLGLDDASIADLVSAAVLQPAPAGDVTE